MTRPNGRLLQAAHLLEQLAPQVTAADEHVNRELAIADSYPRQTPGASAPTSHGEPPVCRCEPGNRVGCDVCSPVHLTATERAADQRVRLNDQATRLRELIHLTETTTHEIGTLCRDINGTRLEHPPKLCDCSGHEGAELARSDGGWSDPTCQDIATKAGLCDACYMRKRRYLVRIGRPPRNDIEAA